MCSVSLKAAEANVQSLEFIPILKTVLTKCICKDQVHLYIPVTSKGNSQEVGT